jgi:hypothetical protein
MLTSLKGFLTQRVLSSTTKGATCLSKVPTETNALVCYLKKSEQNLYRPIVRIILPQKALQQVYN